VFAIVPDAPMDTPIAQFAVADVAELAKHIATHLSLRH
jgi:hypothetical protein